jgi:hypothetical protein
MKLEHIYCVRTLRFVRMSRSGSKTMRGMDAELSLQGRIHGEFCSQTET